MNHGMQDTPEAFRKSWRHQFTHPGHLMVPCHHMAAQEEGWRKKIYGFLGEYGAIRQRVSTETTSRVQS
jgi:hypothetical protein